MAAGIRQMKDIQRPLESVLPPSIKWIQDSAECFEPGQNTVYTNNGATIVYDFMVVAVGLQNDYDKVI